MCRSRTLLIQALSSSAKATEGRSRAFQAIFPERGLIGGRSGSKKDKTDALEERLIFCHLFGK